MKLYEFSLKTYAGEDTFWTSGLVYADNEGQAKDKIIRHVMSSDGYDDDDPLLTLDKEDMFETGSCLVRICSITETTKEAWIKDAYEQALEATKAKSLEASFQSELIKVD